MQTANSITNSSANKLYQSDRAAHDWYRFVLSFPAHLVREYLVKFGVDIGQQVLDPFCGTGTTLVECKKLGIPSVGIEANPVAHFAAQVKVDWGLDPDGLLKHARQVAAEALSELEEQGIEDEPVFLALTNGRDSEHWVEQQNIALKLRGLTPELEKLLLTDSISPLPLHKSLLLLDHLNRYTGSRYHSHEVLAFAKALVSSISNLHFGPEVGVGPMKPDAPVLNPWLFTVGAMADDLRTLVRSSHVPATVYHADARQVSQVIAPHSIDAVITSPPYPNEKDYTRTTRLEAVLLGFVQSRQDLQDLKRGLVRSNTRSVYKEDDDDKWVAQHPEIQRIADAIEARRIELGKTSGFERLYARLTRLYFGGMTRHLADLRTVLRPGAQLAYVVGDQASYLRVMIRTGQLLADIAGSLGYEVTSIDLFRTRLATATREQLREEVVVLKWPGSTEAD
jgi:hypothetical protein